MGDTMTNKIESGTYQYLKWRGDLSFEQDKFNEVDAFVLTQIAYYDFNKIIGKEPIKLKDALKIFYESSANRKIKLGLILPDDIAEMGKLVLKVKRYENVYLSDYVDKYDNKIKEQFCALCFHLSENYKVVIFKGTDDTLIGWQEDFNMMVSFPIPAQTSALEYTHKLANKYKDATFTYAGHSKGGNLSMYSAIYLPEDIQNRIHLVYNFDGPGFESNNIDVELYSKVKSKIKTILPTHSIIGMIFNQIGVIKTVKSSAKAERQHDGLTWCVEGNRFVRSTLSKNSIEFSKDLNNLVGKLSMEERKSLSESVDKYIVSLDVKTLIEIPSVKMKPVQNLKMFSKKERTIFLEFVKILFKYHILK